MSWQRIAAEMSAMLEAAERQEWQAEVADRAEAEAARIRLADRLAVAAEPIGVQVAGGWVRGGVVEVGTDFVVLDDGAISYLVPLAAVDAVTGLPPGAREPGSEGEVAARYRLSAALRALLRQETMVRVITRSEPVLGTITGVGADHLRLRRSGSDAELIVPFAGICELEIRA